MSSTQERFKTNEEKVQYLLKQQDTMADKWRSDYHNSMKYYEGVINDLHSQIRTLKRR